MRRRLEEVEPVEALFDDAPDGPVEVHEAVQHLVELGGGDDVEFHQRLAQALAGGGGVGHAAVEFILGDRAVAHRARRSVGGHQRRQGVDLA